MIIAVASGKGGTGKTTVATNIAALLAEGGRDIFYVDCDVEEPDGKLFLKPEMTRGKTIKVPKPEIDADKCDGCALCREICQYNAIVVILEKAMAFHELCHSCGGCRLVCPMKAIADTDVEIGAISEGKAGNLGFLHGELKVGTPSAVPLIRELKKEIPDSADVILDAPAGASCPVVETISGSDFTALVTEPTPFGLNDLKIAVETVRILGIPFGVIINRSKSGYDIVNDFCRKEGIIVLGEIPDKRAAAETYSKGEMLFRAIPGFRELFENIYENIKIEIWKYKNSGEKGMAV
ncbi:MAG: P-loop NTPase [candidate division Zixibacteria bacterium]|nr:P-loop NTPase [candidate division Zixibacteria bacterium]